jgi:hypothetical protein
MKMFEKHWSRGLLLHLFTIGRTPLDEISAFSETFRLPDNPRHPQEKSIPPVGFEHPTPASETTADPCLDRAAS